MFTKDYHIERFNTFNGKLRIDTLFHYLNDIMERNAESYGMGADYHIKQNLAWVLVEYQLDIESLPSAGKPINVGTIPYSFKRIYGYRLYEGYSDDELVFKGKGKFALIDIKKKNFVRPTDDMLARFTDAKDEPEALDFKKWKIDTTNLITTFKRQVSSSHIDINGHLNNAYFAAYAYEALNDDMLRHHTIKTINVKFKKEVFAGDIIEVSLYQTMPYVYVVLSANGETLSEVSFELSQ